jgi:uncharacterized surface protein with fasciclin (FAS1) repeats
MPVSKKLQAVSPQMKGFSMKQLKIWLAALATMALAACGGGDDDPPPPPAPVSIVATAQATPSLSTLVAVVQFASENNDLVNLLANPGTLTVFAPSNAAFDALAVELTGSSSAKAADLLTAANKPLLRTVLQYHVLTSTVRAAQIPFGKPITTAQGGVFKIDTGSPPVITDGRNRKTNITSTDITATNGVVHLVDKVLLPADKNIVQTAQALPDFSILVEAVVAADLATTLSGSGPFTVFAPTNAAFAALLTELNVTKDQLLANKPLLTAVLTYHVVPARVFKADVPVGAPITTVQGETFTVNAQLAITDQRSRTANIAATDVLTSNGVIHVIDKVILPKP